MGIKGKLSAIPAVAALMVAGLTAPAPAASEQGLIASGRGTAIVAGETMSVEVMVYVPPGKSPKDEVAAALRREKADPISNEYSYTGLVWDNAAATQNYNPSKQPLATETALRNTHTTWNGASGSTFRFSYGGTTTRCPSLVQQCPGPQVRDGFNDVGWAKLGGNTLGVTWSTTSNPDEADMALNTAFAWNTGCTNVANKIDLETVLLHENGHVVGLGHSSNTAAVMYASYQGARCSLHSDDVAGIASLY